MLLKLGQAGCPLSLLDDLETLVHSHKCTDFDELQSTFFNLARIFKEVRIVIDGFDECDPISQADVFKFCQRTSNFCATSITTYLSGRYDICFQEELGKYPTLSLSDMQPASDLEIFIQEKVSELRSDGSLVFRSSALYLELVQRLTKKAAGM